MESEALPLICDVKLFMGTTRSQLIRGNIWGNTAASACNQSQATSTWAAAEHRVPQCTAGVGKQGAELSHILLANNDFIRSEDKF